MAARVLRVIPRLTQGVTSVRALSGWRRTIVLPVQDNLCVQVCKSLFYRPYGAQCSICKLYFQKRYSQVNVFGPFDPPKPLTLKEVRLLMFQSCIFLCVFSCRARFLQSLTIEIEGLPLIYCTRCFQVEQRVLKAIRAWDRFPADKVDTAILIKVICLLQEKLLTMDATFAQDLGFDSLDQVNVSKVHCHF